MKGKENRGELQASLCSQTLKDWAEDLNSQALSLCLAWGHEQDLGGAMSFSVWR